MARMPATTKLLILSTLLAAATLARAACDASAAPGDTPLSEATRRDAADEPLFAGRRVTVSGAVTRLVHDGFFVQRPRGPDAPLAPTPEALRVYLGADARSTVRVGDQVRFTARVHDWHGVAEFVDLDPRSLHVIGDGCVVAPVPLAWPPAKDGDARARAGMVVTLAGPLTVQDAHEAARHGERLLAAGGRQRAPTDIVAPGLAARRLAQAQARERLLLDEDAASSGVRRAGDVVEGLAGVLDIGPASRDEGAPRIWRLRATAPVHVVPANPRTDAPPAVGGDARVGVANLDNFFLSPADGRPRCGPHDRASDCRGARTKAAYEHQRDRLAAMLAGLDADVLALMELQNDGDAAAAAIARALNIREGGHAVWAPVAGAPGGSDAIRVALLYRTDRVRPVGGPAVDTDPMHVRLPVAQVFQWPGGARVAVVAAHFKSKRCGGAPVARDAASEPVIAADKDAEAAEAAGWPPASLLDADLHDGQACWNARRTAEAHALRAFAHRVQEANDRVDVLVVGDLNAYAHEDPVEALRAGGLVDLLERPGAAGDGPFPYSFVFDGRAGRLDHAFASPGLAPRVTGAAEWHVDADEPEAPEGRGPWRASDHDPMVIGLKLGR